MFARTGGAVEQLLFFGYFDAATEFSVDVEA